MTGLEFVVVLAWLLLPPLLLGSVGLLAFHRRRPPGTHARLVGAWLVLLSLSFAVTAALLALGPGSIGPYLGVRDRPFTWAPCAFLAVVVAFPVAVWWGNRWPAASDAA